MPSSSQAAADRRADGERGLLQDDGQVGVAGQFVADGAHAAPGGVAQPAGGRGRGQQALHEPVQRGGVRLDVGFEGQVAPGQHDRGAVVADGARESTTSPSRDLRRPRAPARPG